MIQRSSWRCALGVSHETSAKDFLKQQEAA
jgi:hypothetical protein